MGRHLECADAAPGLGSSLLQGQFPQLEKLDRLPLPGRQPADRLRKCLVVADRCINIRFRTCKGYVEIVDRNLVSFLATVSTCGVREPMSHDCQQPWRKSAPRIVGMTNGVDRQQDVLHQVLDIRQIEKRPSRADDPANTWSEEREERSIRLGITALGAAHEVAHQTVVRVVTHRYGIVTFRSPPPNISCDGADAVVDAGRRSRFQEEVL